MQSELQSQRGSVLRVTKSVDMFPPIRYIKEDISKTTLRKTATKILNEKLEEKLYGQSLSNTEKHRMIMDLIVSKKQEKFRKTKKEKFLQKRRIERNKKQYLQMNKKRMLEVKWKNKISYLSLQNYKDKIEKQHWRIGDSIRHLKKKPKKIVVKRRIYTPQTEQRLKKKMKPFKRTNEFGLTPKQVKKVEKKFNKKKAQTKIYKSKTEDGHTHIVKKTILRKYKVKPKEEEAVPSEEEVEPEGEGEEEVMENEENQNVDNVDEIEEEPEVENQEENPVEEIKKKTNEDANRYQPLYPDYDENGGIGKIEVPDKIEDVEQQQPEEAEEQGEQGQDGEGEDQTQAQNNDF